MATKVKLARAARSELRSLGSALKYARLRRRLTAELVAQRAGITRPTLTKIEAGDPSVKIGSYAAVLQALGLINGWGKVADSYGDQVSIDELPQRARLSDGR